MAASKISILIQKEAQLSLSDECALSLDFLYLDEGLEVRASPLLYHGYLAINHCQSEATPSQPAKILVYAGRSFPMSPINHLPYVFLFDGRPRNHVELCTTNIRQNKAITQKYQV